MDTAAAVHYARALASRLMTDRVSRDVLFVALTNRVSGRGLTTQKMCGLLCLVHDSLALYLDAQPRPILPEDLAMPPDERAPVPLGVETTAPSECTLLTLLEQDGGDEFDWYFDAADRVNATHADRDRASVERTRARLGDYHADRMWESLSRPRRAALTGQLRCMLHHPEYPFDEIAGAIQGRDMNVVNRVWHDADMLKFLSWKHGISPRAIIEMAGII